jgi:quercetin dioxygenase-like cupin family protein
MAESKGKVVHYSQVSAEVMGEQAPGTRIRWLIDDAHDGAPVYALRMVEIEAGGHSLHHDHPYEHENFVVEGHGKVFMSGEWNDLKPGDVVFVPPGVEHEYANTGDSTFKFLCGIPVTRLREQK